MLGTRIRQARLAVEMTQVELALALDIGIETASSRVSQYESGGRTPDPALVERMGEVLRRPASWFYESDPQIAALILDVWKLKPADRRKVIALAAELASK